jgi:hypothetical protein
MSVRFEEPEVETGWLQERTMAPLRWRLRAGSGIGRLLVAFPAGQRLSNGASAHRAFTPSLFADQGDKRPLSMANSVAPPPVETRWGLRKPDRGAHGSGA